MRYRKLLGYLKKWQAAGLITSQQVENIAVFGKAEARRQFLRLVRALFILGGIWLVFGTIAAFKLLPLELLRVLYNAASILVTPVIILAEKISPRHHIELLAGIACLAVWGALHWLGLLLQKRSVAQMTRLSDVWVPELRLGRASLVAGYVFATIAFQCFNEVIRPDMTAGTQLIILFPWFSLLGGLFFMGIAYRRKDEIALLFSIGFIAQCVGLATAYYYATYAIGVSMPTTQMMVGVLLLFVGMWHVEKIRGQEDHFMFMFGRTYQWTGLIFIYLSLWVMSLWGMTSGNVSLGLPPTTELWLANILFISATLGAMFYGASKEDRMYFNFGITFFIIESYTVFFSRLWSNFGTAFGSIALGAMLIATGYFLRHLFLKRVSATGRRSAV